MLVRLAHLATLAAAALILDLAFAIPAHAETTATVRAHSTHRMNGPNSSAGHDGSYKSGQLLTIVCQTLGEPVRGHFSSHIPDGGWDNLWYQTADGHFVADVDVETPALYALGPQCGQAADAPASTSAAEAVAGPARGSTIDHNPFGQYAGYCTWGAQEQIHEHTGYYVKALTGNAEDWANQARAAGWTVVDEPQPHSIVVLNRALAPGVGHVAWVDAVNGWSLTITEMNFGPGATPENEYHTAGFGQFDTRTIRAEPGMNYILIP